MKKLFSGLFFLQAAALFAGEEGGEAVKDRSSFWQTLIMIAIAILFFYFILWRPEQKRRKDIDKKRGSMKKGDHITVMGIVGTVDNIKEKTVVVKNIDGSKIEVLKGAISEVKSSTEVLEAEKS